LAPADDPVDLPPLNRKVLQFARDNFGKQVADGECAMLVLEAFAAAGARMPTPEEALARVFGRRLKADEKPLPGDVVEFKGVRLEAKGVSTEIPFHTAILLTVKDGKFVLLNQNVGGERKVTAFDLSGFELKRGELIVYRPVPPGTTLPKIPPFVPLGTWAEKPADNRKVRYLSDLAEFDVVVAEKVVERQVQKRAGALVGLVTEKVVVKRYFGKKGNLGYGAGNSFKIIVMGKDSPNGLSMVPASKASCWARYRLKKTAHTFMAFASLNDSAGAPGKPPGVGKIPTPVTFRVLGDGKELWKSNPVDAARNVQECKVDVTGVDVLELRVDCPGSSVNAHPVWLEPRVLLR
jgi:hypothetical protein